MSDNSELPQNDITPEPLKVDEIETQKPYDFWLGFSGALIGNVLLYILIVQIVERYIPYKLMNATFLVLPLALNIGAIIWFSIKKRRKIVGGILVIASIAFIISLCLSTECFGIPNALEHM